jgi:hypothetical protein
MRVPSYIVSMALLAGFAAAQTVPASQTVSNNSPQQPAKPAKATAKVLAKSPFVPKPRVTAAQNTKDQTNKPAKAQNGKQQKVQQSQTAAKPKNGPVVQAKAKPETGNPALANTRQPKKEAAKRPEQKKPEVKEAAKKQEPKKPESKPAPVQAKTEPKAAEPAQQAPTLAPAVVQNEPAKLPSPGKRDPFLSPLMAAGARNPSNCTTGKRCLVIDQIVLKGVVQMKNGNLALVENAGKRPYVLHENDSLFNGSVVKITGDSLILREESNDILGRPISREVVKKVTAPSV